MTFCNDEGDVCRYLRKCEHRAVTVVRTQELLARHGTVWSVGTVYEVSASASVALMFCWCSATMMGVTAVSSVGRGSVTATPPQGPHWAPSPWT